MTTRRDEISLPNPINWTVLGIILLADPGRPSRWKIAVKASSIREDQARAAIADQEVVEPRRVFIVETFRGFWGSETLEFSRVEVCA